MRWALLLVVCLIVGDFLAEGSKSKGSTGKDSKSKGKGSKGKSNCGKGKGTSRDSGSDLVTLEDFEEHIVGQDWIGIYSSKFTESQTFCRKGNQRWTDSSFGLAELFCYSPELGLCLDLSFNTTKSEDECGRVTEKGDGDDDIKFYSQDLSKYFWHDVCYVKVGGVCQVQYLGLLVKAWRGAGELDLQGLPWGLIADDLWNNFGLTFTGPVIQFSWKDGPNCGFSVSASSGA